MAHGPVPCLPLEQRAYFTIEVFFCFFMKSGQVLLAYNRNNTDIT